MRTRFYDGQLVRYKEFPSYVMQVGRDEGDTVYLWFRLFLRSDGYTQLFDETETLNKFDTNLDEIRALTLEEVSNLLFKFPGLSRFVSPLHILTDFAVGTNDD